MGNRAVIKTNNSNIGIYLHWNGGRDSVEAFLKYCELKNYRTPDKDSYGWARLTQVISNFLGGSTTIGIEELSKLDQDNYDNGVYVIKGWEIVDRKYFDGTEQNEYDLKEMLIDIDEAQPKNEQLGSDYLNAEIIPTNQLKIGDEIYYSDYSEKVQVASVIGFGADEMLNGTNVKNIPFTDRYASNNINAYLIEDTYRVRN